MARHTTPEIEPYLEALKGAEDFALRDLIDKAKTAWHRNEGLASLSRADTILLAEHAEDEIDRREHTLNKKVVQDYIAGQKRIVRGK
jgi:hypothetical protein